MAGSVSSQVAVSKSRGLKRIGTAFTTTDAGVVTATDMGVAYGRIVGLLLDAGDLDTGCDITIKDKTTGANLIVITNTGTTDLAYRPTAVVRDATGTAVAAAATAVDINRDIYVFGTVTITVAAGGDAKSGALYLVVDEG